MDNKTTAFWKFVWEKSESNIPTVLLFVLESEGSSPGRQGFKMAVTAEGHMFGSIGGGVMEKKLIEKAKDMMEKGEGQFFFIQQYHDKTSLQDQSGMICSGRQSIVLCPLAGSVAGAIKRISSLILDGGEGLLSVGPGGISFQENGELGRQYNYFYESDGNWLYKEAIGYKQLINIIGGGHVGLALSKIMSFLGFYVKVFDDRPGLNTLQQNTFVNEKIIIAYDRINEYLMENEEHYVAIMTFGYRTDKIVLRQLIGKKFRYLGMMGSEAKNRQLFEELRQEGVAEVQLGKVHAPIGLALSSKTPEEIAVSIAAQIVQIKNSI